MAHSNNGYEEFPCDLCGCSESIEMPHVREYTDGQVIDICTNCGFIYVKKRRSFEKIAQVWTEELFGKAYSSRNPVMYSRHHYVADFVDTKLDLKSKQVCDIGAGEGQFLNIVREQYTASVFGIEPSESNCKLMDEMGIDNFIGTVEEYPEAGEKMDIAFIMWTLEACQSCRQMLSDAYRILKPDGHVVIVTGSRILVPFKKPIYCYLSKTPVDTHPFRFSANTLRGILAESHFEEVYTNGYINNDIFCMIAKKTDMEKTIAWEKDNYLDVYEFFRRWHLETETYYPKEQFEKVSY